MKVIAETMERNRENMAILEERIKLSGFQLTALQKNMDRLTNDIETKTDLINNLQTELSQKDIRIKRLHQEVTTLSSNIENLQNQAEAQSEQLNKKEEELNSAYYC